MLKEKQAGFLARASFSCRLPVFTVAGHSSALTVAGTAPAFNRIPFIPSLVPVSRRILYIVFVHVVNTSILYKRCTVKKLPGIFVGPFSFSQTKRTASVWQFFQLLFCVGPHVKNGHRKLFTRNARFWKKFSIISAGHNTLCIHSINLILGPV